MSAPYEVNAFNTRTTRFTTIRSLGSSGFAARWSRAWKCTLHGAHAGGLLGSRLA